MNGDPFGLVGRVIDGTFRVDALVGDGDLSVVYRGYHLGIQTPIAIKCLHLPDTLDPELTRPVVAAFEDAGRLHDHLGRGNLHVAQTLASGRTIAPRTGASIPYRVREWFEGESLASDLARRRRNGVRPRTVDEGFTLLAPAIEGIAHAHDEGIAHLSLDPGNLFLARDEGPPVLKVLDFGTARASHSADARPTLDSELTRGLHLLHPAFAAPEQLDMDVGEPGMWTDVYALALVMMDVLAERSNVEGRDTGALVERALDRHKRPTPEAHGLSLPRTFDLVLTRAVARSPEKRQKNARVFLNELKDAMGYRAPQRVSARAPSPRAVSAVVSKPAPPPDAAPNSASLKPAAPPKRASRPLEALPPAPAAAASGPIAAAQDPEEPPMAPRVSAPSLLPPHASPDLALGDFEAKLTRRRWRPSPRSLRIGALVAAGALFGILTVLIAFLRAHRANETERTAPSASTLASAVARPAAAPPMPAAAETVASRAATNPPSSDPGPGAPAPVVPAAAAEPPAAATPPTSGARSDRGAHAHPAAAQPTVRFSRAAAQRAINGVTRKASRCRHGRFWGNGYATIAFDNDGSVDRVLVDPPFSMTVTGKCVADALEAAHMRPFLGKTGYFRFRFYVAR